MAEQVWHVPSRRPKVSSRPPAGTSGTKPTTVVEVVDEAR